MLIDMMKVAN